MEKKKRDLEEEILKSEKRIETTKNKLYGKEIGIESKISNLLKLANSLVVIGFVFLISGIIIYFAGDDLLDLNLLGDFTGGTVASIWSLAGILFIYIAFLGQKQQLLNQQLEIQFSQLEVKYTQLELSDQKEEMKLQNRTLKNQQFDNTFFNLLSNHNSIVNTMDIGKNNQKTARDCFEVHRDAYFAILYRDVKDINHSSEVGNIPLIETLNHYNTYYKTRRADLGHYFRNLYHIVKFVDESDQENKKRYTNFIRAQLSAYELVVLFYNGLSNYGEKFGPYINKYSLLKNLEEEVLINKDHKLESINQEFYSAKAFGKVA